MRTWLAALGALAMVTGAACGGSGSGDGAEVEPGALVGETEQGLRMRIDLVGDREVSLRLPANCGVDEDSDDGSPVPMHGGRRFEAQVDDHGGFTVEEAYVEYDAGDSEDHVEVRIDGDFADDGTATGTIEATDRYWDDERGRFLSPCDTGTVAWTADRPAAERHDVEVPTAEEILLAPVGADLMAGSGSELVRIDGATGEARHVVGAPAGSATTTTGSGAPPTVVVGGPAAAGEIWQQEMAVVADGVWMVDPATGAVTRFELADGARTATIAAPIDHMAATPDALWTVSTNIWRSGYALDRRDPVTGAVLATTPAERGLIVVGPTDVWYLDGTLAGGRVRRVDPATLAFGDPFEVDIPLFDADPVATQDRLWWLELDRLMSLDLTSGQVGPVDLPSIPVAVAADATGVWVAHEQEAVARRIEGGRVVRTLDIPDGWWDLAVSPAGTVWLSGDGTGDENPPRVVRLDPAVTAG